MENFRLMIGELLVTDVRNQVMLSLVTNFENFSVVEPAYHHEKSVIEMLDQVIAGSPLRKSLWENGVTRGSSRAATLRALSVNHR